MLRKLTAVIVVTGVVLVGLVAQAGSYLLAPPGAEHTPADGESSLSAPPGSHVVGVRVVSEEESPIPATVWFPALGDPTPAGTSYSYSINMLGPDTAIALATYSGKASHGLAADRSDGPYPLVILSHGFAISASSYAWLAEHLASWGFVVVAPHHRESLDPGRLWRSTIDRPVDVDDAIAFADQATSTGGFFRGMIDTSAVAVVGHSYGGYTALVAAGARIAPDELTASCEHAYRVDDPLVFLCDALLPHLDEMAQLAGTPSDPTAMWPSLTDSEVDAVVSIAGDAAMFGESGLAAITVPVMAIGGTADTDSPFEWGTRLTYDYVGSARKVEVALEGTGHMVFAGGCESVRRVLSVAPLGFCSDPAWDREEVHGLVKQRVADFLLAELRQDSGAAAKLGVGALSDQGVEYRVQGYGEGGSP